MPRRVVSARRSPIALVVAMLLVAGCASNSATPAPMPSGGSASQPPPSATGSGAPGATPQPGDGSGSLSPTPGGTATGSGSPAPEDPRVAAALAALDTDQKLAGQLLMVGWSGETPDSVMATLSRLLPGGIVYIGSNADTAAEATAINGAIHDAAVAVGLAQPFISIDHEGGRIQRIQDVPNLGSNMEFGHRDPTDAEACARGHDQASVLADMGFNMNLAPDVDVLTNPNNTVIADRAYSSDPDVVARLGAAYTQGLQGAGIAAVAKHFPGHGSTDVDSHQGLPVVPFGLPRLERVELVPFVREIQPDVSVAAVMIGHLAMIKLDPTGTPASLSRPVVQGLLRDRMRFQGLVMTDDLGAMAAVTSHYTPADAAVLAISAGVDMLLVVGTARSQLPYRDAIVQGLASGSLDRGRVMDAARHVLEVKARFGLLGGGAPPAVAC